MVRHPDRGARRALRRQLRRRGRRLRHGVTDHTDGTPTTPKPPTGSDAAALAQALKDIQAAYDDGREALRDGDFAAYGEAQKRLDDAIQRAVAAAPQGGSVTVTPSPTGTATATPTPTATP